MKNLFDNNASRNFRNKIKKHRSDDMIGSDISLKLFEYMESLEGQILNLNHRVEQLTDALKGEGNGDD